MKKQTSVDKKKLIRETNHLTRPPRLEGVVKNAGLKKIYKKRSKK